VRNLIKARLDFATRRWGGSGTLFAWDLWNEMHPVQGEDRPDCFEDYIGDIGPFLRDLETRVHGRPHLQTVSIFGPELHWKPWLNAPVFRHPALDFANNHFYEEGTIDAPADTVAPALAVAKLVTEALGEITDGRPFFETEHGPIHTFKDHGITLPAEFDDEYFRHMQWAHLAAGGAGGGMRWPNRNPHSLTLGMRDAQRALALFLPLIDWGRFRRQPASVACDDAAVACVACADREQAVLFLLRTGPLLSDGRVDPALRPGVRLGPPARATATFYDPVAGTVLSRAPACDVLETPAFGACLAVAIR
jgi:mannan endo-1,4-beta-mannosidase